MGEVILKKIQEVQFSVIICGIICDWVIYFFI